MMTTDNDADLLLLDELRGFGARSHNHDRRLKEIPFYKLDLVDIAKVVSSALRRQIMFRGSA